MGPNDAVQLHLKVGLYTRISGFVEAVVQLISLLIQLEKFTAKYRGLKHCGLLLEGWRKVSEGGGVRLGCVANGNAKGSYKKRKRELW